MWTKKSACSAFYAEARKGPWYHRVNHLAEKLFLAKVFDLSSISSTHWGKDSWVYVIWPNPVVCLGSNHLSLWHTLLSVQLGLVVHRCTDPPFSAEWPQWPQRIKSPTAASTR